LEYTGIGNDFTNRSPIAWGIKERTDEWDYIGLQCFCKSKEIITGVKRQPTEWERTFASYSFDKGLISRMYKELKELITKRTNNQINKCVNE
jgi:hypothetical protein